MHNAVRRLRSLGPWLAEPKYVWLALGVSLLALVACLRPSSSEQYVRLTGLALQILGIGTVAWGILETRALFGHPSPVTQAWRWLKRFPLRGQTISASVGIAVGRDFAGKLRGYSKVPIDPSADISLRIEVVERNITLIHDRIAAVARDIDDDIGTLRSRIEEEGSKRELAEGKLHSHIEKVSTGGFYISAIGAVWLFVGVVLSTAAPEIAQLLK